jgi:hypothetical protein
MNKHHIVRLEKLYTFLGTIKPAKFDFSYWATAANDSDTAKDITACGTTACAMGWAGSMPEFRKRGLKLIWERHSNSGHVVFTDRDGERFFGEEAGEVFFGLTCKEAEFLFIPASDTAEKMPVNLYRRRLRKFIDRKKSKLGIK